MLESDKNLRIYNLFFSRTKAAVRELDNLNYRKMKKILMNDACEIESTIGDPEEIQDIEPRGNDSSKSNSITSEHSLHSVGVTASSQVSWVNTNKIQKKIEKGGL
jgi:thousand and one amino acid protein kinase